MSPAKKRAPLRPADHPLLLKLGRFTKLSPAERNTILDMVADTEQVPADTELVRQGERLKEAIIIEDGWASRQRLLDDGRRQIMNFLLPGDLFDLCAFLLTKSDHTIATLTPCTISRVPASAVTKLFDRHPRLGAALWMGGLQEEAILRERITSLGRRTAEERTAHLLYELWVRLSMVGERTGTSFVLPVTQTELADALGLTSVHISRTLRKLRKRGLVGIEGRKVTILRPRNEDAYGEFGHDHLHDTVVRRNVPPPSATI
jgi:CRP-like cAMP-binding protein